MIEVLRRLKDRRVVQWAIAYAAGAWVLLQVLDLLANAYHLPAALMQIAPILLGIGLVAVLVLAWYHGERGAQRVSGPELLMLATLFLIAGVSVAFFAHSRKPGNASADAPAVSSASVAVLPFKNFSSDKEQEYFSDGITEEILNVLAQVKGLEVAARTSSFAFKDKDVPIDSIGARLHVAHVLEGSVRKSGNQLRITAQLINAKTGFHVWSQTFDREDKDVFAVQDEIARSVAAELKGALEPQATRVALATISPAAHKEYLLGLHHWNERTGPDMLLALQHFARATQLQPDYAAAYAGLANTWGVIPVWVDTIRGVDALAKAKIAAERAVALNPNLAEAHAALGWVAAFTNYDWDTAIGHFQKAESLNPSYATALQWHGEIMIGRDPAKALVLAKKAVDADPLSRVVTLQLGHAYMALGDYRKAEDTYSQVVELDRTWPNGYRSLVTIYIVARDQTRALETYQRMKANTSGAQSTDSLVIAAAFDPRARPAAIAELRKMRNPVRRGLYLSMLHDREGTLQAIDEAIAARHTDEQRFAHVPWAPWLRNEPRYQAALARMHLN